MADTGFKYPQTTATYLTNWSNHEYIKADDSNYAASSFTAQGTVRPIIYGSNFGFTIPDGATIDGVEVVCGLLGYQGHPASTIYDYYVTASSCGSKSVSSAFSYVTITAKTYGGATDKWDGSPTVAQLNASTFEITFQCAIYNKYSGSTSTAYMDYMKVKIYYTEASGPALLKTVNGLAKASVKTLRSGLVIASGKTYNTLA